RGSGRRRPHPTPCPSRLPLGPHALAGARPASDATGAPPDGVADDAAHVLAVVGGVLLVAGPEVEHPPRTDRVGTAGPELVSARESRVEDDRVRLAAAELLVVHLLVLDDEVADPGGHRVIG